MVKQSDMIQMEPDELLNFGDTVFASRTGGTPFVELKIRGRLKSETEAQHKDHIRIIKKYRSEGILYRKINDTK